MDMEYINGLMDQVMLVNLRMVNLVEKESIVGQMRANTTVNGLIIK